MDNKLRIKRIKIGISLLEKGKDPFYWFNSISFMEHYGVSKLGYYLLVVNGITPMKHNMKKHGFKYSEVNTDMKIMLHNWKLFLKFIDKENNVEIYP